MTHVDLTGKIFGRLKVVGVAPQVLHADGRYVERHWNCACTCGGAKNVRQSSLVKGKAKSCGCLAAEYRRSSKKIGQRKRARAKVATVKVEPPVVLTPFLREGDRLVDTAIHNMVAWGRQFDHVPLNSPIVPIGAHQ